MTILDHTGSTEPINSTHLDFADNILSTAPTAFFLDQSSTRISIDTTSLIDEDEEDDEDASGETIIETYTGFDIVASDAGNGQFGFGSGTITGFSETEGAITAYAVSDISISILEWKALAQAQDWAAINTLFLGGNDSIYGGLNNDNIRAEAGNDFVRAGDGNDIIDAGAGDDFVNGNKHNDLIYGGDGNDRILGGKHEDIIFGEEGADTVNGNLGNDLVYGEEGNDIVHGGKDDDEIYGDEGDDRMFGDLGNDIIHGGAGADAFIFNANSGLDIIQDFVTGTDTIEISSSIFATEAAAVAAFSNGILNLGDGNVVTLTGITSVTEADFVIV